MKTMWPWVLAGFSFLLSVRAVRNLPGIPGERMSFAGIWREILDLYFSMLLIVTVHAVWSVSGFAAGTDRETGFLILWLLAYGVGRLQGKTDLFFIVTAILAHSAVLFSESRILQFSFLTFTAAVFFCFRVVFQGLRHALLFTNTPSAMKGWPVFCFLAFCITLVMSGILRLVF
ncbi:MAG: hypothetical protein BWY42_01648 [Candidatus Omnitrophica bacterium ADurb.Bin277]|nr:MAG: hypothetical protein BWY42_01648 [Candidatus Omnitrophica bacterium ADurb.Bin277]